MREKDWDVNRIIYDCDAVGKKFLYFENFHVLPPPQRILIWKWVKIFLRNSQLKINEFLFRLHWCHKICAVCDFILVSCCCCCWRQFQEFNLFLLKQPRHIIKKTRFRRQLKVWMSRRKITRKRRSQNKFLFSDYLITIISSF